MSDELWICSQAELKMAFEYHMQLEIEAAQLIRINVLELRYCLIDPDDAECARLELQQARQVLGRRYSDVIALVGSARFGESF